ncbi:MAG: aldo/keto reductase [bacterium]|nr:aldo/keto reductase [bacterium]
MHRMNRRSFFRNSAAGLVAGAAMGGTTRAMAAPAPMADLSATTVRTLGNTGIKCSLLGMGTGVNAWNGSSRLTRQGRNAVLSVFDHAYGKGITYFDLADMYGSHVFMREMLSHTIDRDKVMLSTKTVSREPDFIRADLERFRKELDVDCIDVVLMHCLTERDGPKWTEKHAACMDALSEAKDKGIIRAHGVSCHNFAAMEEAAGSPWVDVMLSRINPFGEKMDGPPEEVAAVLQKAHAAGKGMLGMKIVGEGKLADKIPESMRYVLGLGCVDAMTIGFLESGEIDGCFDHIRTAVDAAEGDAPIGLSDAQFERALDSVGFTAVDFVVVTVVDDNAGKRETVCVDARTFLSSLEAASRPGDGGAVEFAMNQKDRVFHFSSHYTLKKMTRKYTDTALAETRRVFGDMSVSEIDGLGDRDYEAIFKSLPGDPRWHYEAMAHALTERGILCTHGCFGEFRVDIDRDKRPERNARR